MSQVVLHTSLPASAPQAQGLIWNILFSLRLRALGPGITQSLKICVLHNRVPSPNV